MKKTEAEITIKIIAIFYFVIAALTILAGIGSLVGGAFLGFLRTPTLMGITTGILSGSIMVLAGILTIAVGILEAFVGVGLLNHKEWARITTIVISALGVLIGLTMLPFGIVKLVVSGVILYFVAFSKPVTRLFRRR